MTEAEIASLLELQPHLPLAYFFRYMNCTASRNFTGAMEALHRYFDYALQFKNDRVRSIKYRRKGKEKKKGEDSKNDESSKNEDDDESEDVENIFCLQYVMLECRSIVYLSLSFTHTHTHTHTTPSDMHR